MVSPVALYPDLSALLWIVWGVVVELKTLFVGPVRVVPGYAHEVAADRLCLYKSLADGNLFSLVLVIDFYQ